VRDAPAVTRRRFLQQLGGGLALAASSGCGALLGARSPARPEALLIVLSDTHSAYDRYPQILSLVDRVRARHPGVPLAVLFNGDLFERGNVVALRGGGRVDLALLRALARRAPVVFNLGNHEGALFDLAETVGLLRESGATVVSNAADRRTGRLLASPAAVLELGRHRLAVAGVATNDLSTYRAGVRETLRIPDGPEYAPASLPPLLGGAPLRVVLSHEGTVDDRRILPAVPPGSLVVGGHDHLRYAHRRGGTLYLHPGAWGESVALVEARAGPSGAEWAHRELPTAREGEGDADLAALVRAEEAAHLTAGERVVVGRTRRALPPHEAALLAAAALRDAAGADAALIANTTFGAGLPAGPVSRHRFDAFVRFDGGVHCAPVNGTTLGAILRRANQFGDTPFEARTGEYLVATPVRSLDPRRRYTVATVDWVRMNAERYLGTALDFTPVPGLGLKAVVAARLAGERPSIPTRIPRSMG